jgi:hypothetical protein
LLIKAFYSFFVQQKASMKRILAVLAGCIVSVLVIFMSEAISHSMNPPPADFDPTNAEQLKELMANAPFLALFMVQIGAFLGAFVGGVVATSVMKLEDKVPALLVGAVLTVLGSINLLMIPHPLWFNITTFMVYVLGSYSGYRIYLKLKKHA